MREAHAWHGDRRHHAPDAAADTPASRAHDSPSMRVLRDPAAYPGLLHRTGRSDRHAGGCHKDPGPGRRIVSRTAREGLSRLAGQAGPRLPTLELLVAHESLPELRGQLRTRLRACRAAVFSG